jgi:5-methylcytosine-specific restriction endonuclease McrA
MAKRISNKIDNKETRILVFKKYNGHCSYCGCKLNNDNFTIDHIDPRMRGFSDEELLRYGRIRGKDKIYNYNPCCKSCNTSKSNYTLQKWKEEISKKFERIQRDCSSYNLLLRMGLVTEHRKNIKFYFEKL